MKTKYKSYLAILVFLFISLIATGIGVTYASYQTPVTGAVAARTSNFTPELQVVEETHSILPQSTIAVNEIKFYVKNYTGTDVEPTTSEVYLKYNLSFSLPTWGNGCDNPISYELYSVDEANSTETKINSFANNALNNVQFQLMSAEKDYYKLKLYWDMTKNAASCYAGKSGNVVITANISQR